MDLKEIFLSICMPLYNSENTVKNAVESILECKHEDIEIVLYYDESIDNTYKIIKKINDKRIRIVFSECKREYGSMLIECGKSARGKYLMYSIDRNYIFGKKLDMIIEYLKKNKNVVFGISVPIKSGDYIIVDKYKEKLNTFFFIQQHITGTFYRKDVFLSCEEKIRDLNYGNFSPDFITATACSYGDGLLYSTIFQSESDYIASVKKTKSTKVNNKEWYTPIGQKINYKSWIQLLDIIDIDNYDKKILKKKCKKVFLNRATFGYRLLMKDVRFCNHYGISPRNVGNFEIFIYKLLWAFFK